MAKAPRKRQGRQTRGTRGSHCRLQQQRTNRSSISTIKSKRRNRSMHRQSCILISLHYVSTQLRRPRLRFNPIPPPAGTEGGAVRRPLRFFRDSPQCGRGAGITLRTTLGAMPATRAAMVAAQALSGSSSWTERTDDRGEKPHAAGRSARLVNARPTARNAFRAISPARPAGVLGRDLRCTLLREALDHLYAR